MIKNDLHVRLTEEDLLEVVDQVYEGNQVAAIKYIIDHSNYSLQEAKEIVEFIDDPDNDLDQIVTIKTHDNILPPHLNQIDRDFDRIQLHHDTQQVFVIYDDGHQEQITEFHPKWNEAMQYFYAQAYPSVAVLFAERKIENDKLLNQSEQSIFNQTTPASPASSRPAKASIETHNDPLITASSPLASSQQRTQAGVEDLTQKSPLLKLSIFIMVVIAAVVFLLFTN